VTTPAPKRRFAHNLWGALRSELGHNERVMPDPHLKTRVWSIAASGLIAAALLWLPLGRWLPLGSGGEMRLSVLEYIYLPALIPAVVLARAVHGGGDLLMWIAITLQTYAMVSLVAMLVRRARRRAHRS
jgi:hypothetical protein